MKGILAVCVASALSMQVDAVNTNQLEQLTLEQAIEMAERLQPDLAEARLLVDASQGRARQAGAIPNPEAVVRMESAPFKGRTAGEAEYVAGVSQTVPLGNRLGKAREAELAEVDRRAQHLGVRRLEVRKRVHGAFATALYQERAFQTQRGMAASLEKSVATAKARVDAGDALPEDLARAEMELARATVELKRSESVANQARRALSAAVGDTKLSVKSLAGNLDTTFEIPTMEDLAGMLNNHPSLAFADADVRAQNARVDLAKAERIPDVRFELLYRRLEAEKRDAFDIGVTIPLPLFDRRQGRLQEARSELAAARERSRSTQNELARTLDEAHSRLSSALASSRALKAEILPLAETVLKAAELRYEAGDSPLSEVLPVRRDWAAVQMSYLESLRDVMQAWTELASFLNRPATIAR